MKRLALFAACAALLAQDVSVFELEPNETATAIVAYAKYMKAKEAWISAASKIAEEHGVTCPAFSKGFAYVIQDPQCDEQDAPKVEAPATPKATFVNLTIRKGERMYVKTERIQTQRATR